MFLLPDGTFFIQLINFAIFFAILNVVFFRPVQRAIAKRREYIESLTSDYDAAQSEASSLRAQAEAERAAARRDAAAAIATARAHASNESAELATQYAAQVQATVDGARQTVASEVATARSGEGPIVRELADMMLDRTIGGGLR